MAVTLNNAELPAHERGASAVPSLAGLTRKAQRCADMAQALGEGVARVPSDTLSEEQRIGLGRAFDDVHSALARAAAVVGHTPEVL